MSLSVVQVIIALSVDGVVEETPDMIADTDTSSSKLAVLPALSVTVALRMYVSSARDVVSQSESVKWNSSIPSSLL